jgi:putative redox protein
MDTSLTWRDGLNFTGKIQNGFTVPMTTDQDLGGDEQGFKPLELMSLSLGGCTAMDVISILLKKRQDVTSFEVQVHTDQAEEFPKVFTQAIITYLVTGHGVEETALQRAIELSATRYCPAQAMLGKSVEIHLQFEIYEDEGNGKKHLVLKGKSNPIQVPSS